jgi:hypothetical protein
LFDCRSLAEFDGGATGIGEPPSPTITTALVDGLGFSPLTAEIAPANIKLASAAMIVFFMGFNSPDGKIVSKLDRDFGGRRDRSLVAVNSKL